MADDQITQYVADHAPELDPEQVKAFMAEHAKPDDQPGSHVEWAVRVLRERAEGETGEGLSVDRVMNEIRRHDD
ncbi:MAG TPA: hypothetical protein VGL51_12300 [Solirubrobacteraceae bacterium]